MYRLLYHDEMNIDHRRHVVYPHAALALFLYYYFVSHQPYYRVSFRNIYIQTDERKRERERERRRRRRRQQQQRRRWL